MATSSSWSLALGYLRAAEDSRGARAAGGDSQFGVRCGFSLHAGYAREAASPQDWRRGAARAAPVNRGE